MEALIENINKQTSYFEKQMLISSFESPLGTIWIGAIDQGICFVEFFDRVQLEKELAQLANTLKVQLILASNSHAVNLQEELKLYFDKKLQKFTIPLVITGTNFQQKVYQSLQNIPFGKTVTYKQQAEQLGDVKAIRAMATANGQNKHAIVIPCHRVIGSNGSLVGYAGGLWRKKALLELESDTVQTAFIFF